MDNFREFYKDQGKRHKVGYNKTDVMDIYK